MSPFAKLIRVNETGYQMLLLCETLHTAFELVSATQKIFGLEEREAALETERFLAIMLKCGLLEQVETNL